MSDWQLLMTSRECNQLTFVAGVHGATGGHVRGRHQQLPAVWHGGPHHPLSHRLHRRGLRQQVRGHLPHLRHHLHLLHLHRHLRLQRRQQHRVSHRNKR